MRHETGVSVLICRRTDWHASEPGVRVDFLKGHSDPRFPLAGGTAFGPFVSRNLTPNASGLPANLTLEQFVFVLETGTDVKGRPPFVPSEENDLLQVMPWPVHRNMTRTDKEAIYEFLRAIPCLGSAERCGN